MSVATLTDVSEILEIFFWGSSQSERKKFSPCRSRILKFLSIFFFNQEIDIISPCLIVLFNPIRNSSIEKLSSDQTR